MDQAAHAQDTIYGFTSNSGVNGNLFSFQSSTPGTTTNLGTITGVTGTLLDIDFRPANGLLYGLGQSGSTLSLYTISTTNGMASLVTTLTGVTATAGSYDIDFNPQANALRIVGSNGDNFRVAGAQIGTGLGATLTDTALTGGSNIIGVAYTNNVAGTPSTTLYDINTSGQLFLQGSVNGTPNSPNGGALTTVGNGTGIVASELGFDISGVFPSNAYVAANNTFYTVNLGTGTSTTVGAINTSGLNGTVRGISAVTPVVGAPEPGSIALLGTGLLSMGGLAVRRKSKKV